MAKCGHGSSWPRAWREGSSRCEQEGWLSSSVASARWSQRGQRCGHGSREAAVAASKARPQPQVAMQRERGAVQRQSGEVEATSGGLGEGRRRERERPCADAGSAAGRGRKEKKKKRKEKKKKEKEKEKKKEKEKENVTKQRKILENLRKIRNRDLLMFQRFWQEKLFGYAFEVKARILRRPEGLS